MSTARIFRDLSRQLITASASTTSSSFAPILQLTRAANARQHLRPSRIARTENHRVTCTPVGSGADIFALTERRRWNAVPRLTRPTGLANSQCHPGRKSSESIPTSALSAMDWTDSADALQESFETRPPMASLIASDSRALEGGKAHPRGHPVNPKHRKRGERLARLLSAYAANRGWNLFHRKLQQ